MIVDRFEIFGLDAKVRNLGNIADLRRHIAHKIFHELRVVIRLFRDEFFVGALQQDPQLARRLPLDGPDKTIDIEPLDGPEPRHNTDMGTPMTRDVLGYRPEEHTSGLPSLMRITY